MPIIFATPPQEGETLVRKGLTQTTARSVDFAAAVSGATGPDIIDPHMVYDLGADRLAKGEDLTAARQTGFRYLVGPEPGPVAAAEIQPDTVAGSHFLAQVNQGPYVTATAKALQSARALAEVAQGTYEVCLLRSAAIYLMALWLKSKGGKADIIIPLDPAPPGLEAEKPYTVADFLKVAQNLAKQISASADKTKTP